MGRRLPIVVYGCAFHYSLRTHTLWIILVRTTSAPLAVALDMDTYYGFGSGTIGHCTIGGLTYFGRFSCYFLLSNFIVIPCATIILYTTVLLFVCFFMPVVQLFIGKALQTIVGAMNTALHSIAHLPGASIEELHPSILQLFFLLYSSALCVLLNHFFQQTS